MKVYMMTDLEGAAGVVTFYSQTGADGKYYEQARRLQTAEINAAIHAGAFRPVQHRSSKNTAVTATAAANDDTRFMAWGGCKPGIDDAARHSQ